MKSTTLQTLLAPLALRIRLLASRARITGVEDGSIQTVKLTGLDGETRSEVPRLQGYGFSSVPLPGAEAVVLSLGADRANMVVIQVDDQRYRLTSLEPGTVALYTHDGSKIVLKPGGNIEITGNVQIFGSLEVTGDVSSSAQVSDSSGTLATLRTGYNSHTHVSGAGVTDPPLPTV